MPGRSSDDAASNGLSIVPLSGDELDAALQEEQMSIDATRRALLRLAKKNGISLIQHP